MVASLRSLPTELIYTIFTFACEPPPIFDLEDIPSNYTSPFLLGAVCRSWRRLAWSQQNLWTCLILDVDARRGEAQAILLKDWLHRSSKLPLSMVIRTENLRRSSTEVIDCVAGPILQLIVSESNRWKTLVVEIPTHRCHAILDTVDDVPLLETLDVQFCLRTPLAFKLFQNTPRLSALATTIPSTLNTDLAYDQLVSWNNITTLTLRHIHIFEVVPILRSTIKLQSCHLLHIQAPQGSFLDAEQIHLPHLQNLAIHMSSVGTILRYLDVPKLKRLSITGTGFLTSSVLLNFFRSQSFVLETLRLTLDPSISIAAIRSLFNIISPSLRILSLHIHFEGRGYDEFLRGLHQSLRVDPHRLGDSATNESLLLPHVEHFDYFAAGNPESSVTYAALMLKERWRVLCDSQQGVDNGKPKLSFAFPLHAREIASSVLAEEVEEGLQLIFEDTCTPSVHGSGCRRVGKLFTN